MNPKDLINWSSLSLAFGYNKTQVSRTRIPKRVQKKVDELIELNKKFLETIKND